MRSAHAFATAACVNAPDLQTSGAQFLDDTTCQGFDIASRVLLDRCDDDTLDLGLLSRICHP